MKKTQIIIVILVILTTVGKLQASTFYFQKIAVNNDSIESYISNKLVVKCFGNFIIKHKLF